MSIRSLLLPGATGGEKAAEAWPASARPFGAPEGTRTPDPLLRRQLLYPPELQARNFAALKVSGESVLPRWLEFPENGVPGREAGETSRGSEPGSPIFHPWPPRPRKIASARVP